MLDIFINDFFLFVYTQLNDKKLWKQNSNNSTANGDPQDPHEYHEISDDEMHGDKFDLGPSLLDEMDYMFRSMSTKSGHDGQPPLSPDFENVNKRNELTEMNSKLSKKHLAQIGSGNIISGKFFGPHFFI